MNTRTLSQHVRQLPELTREDAPSFLLHLTRDPVFFTIQILPLLSDVPTVREPYIAATFGTRETSTCLQVFVWPPNATTAIHDHTAWGAYHCVVGSLFEERYARLDDEAQPNSAHLRSLWRRVWRQSDGVSMVGAYEQGIHRVANQGRHPAISLHMYGPRTGSFDGRDYDPTRDFVCDRFEVDAVSYPRLKRLGLSFQFS